MLVWQEGHCNGKAEILSCHLVLPLALRLVLISVPILRKSLVQVLGDGFFQGEV